MISNFQLALSCALLLPALAHASTCADALTSELSLIQATHQKLGNLKYNTPEEVAVFADLLLEKNSSYGLQLSLQREANALRQSDPKQSEQFSQQAADLRVKFGREWLGISGASPLFRADGWMDGMEMGISNPFLQYPNGVAERFRNYKPTRIVLYGSFESHSPLEIQSRAWLLTWTLSLLPLERVEFTVGGGVLDDLPAILTGIPHVRMLAISAATPTQLNGSTLAEVRKLKQLTHLAIRHFSLPPSSTQALSELQELQHLHLTLDEFSSDNLSPLAALTSLRTLSVIRHEEILQYRYEQRINAPRRAALFEMWAAFPVQNMALEELTTGLSSMQISALKERWQSRGWRIPPRLHGISHGLNANPVGD